MTPFRYSKGLNHHLDYSGDEAERELEYTSNHSTHMTKQDAIAKLDALETGDSELAHSDADSILLDYLRDNGVPEVAEAFIRARDRVSFWYA